MVLVGHILILLLSFYLLAQVCDTYFVPALEKIAIKLKMSSDVAGATLMAIGSSAPELFIAIIAVLMPDDTNAVDANLNIGIGTIVGSALFNILVIVGAVAVVKKAVLSWQPIVRDIIFYSITIIVLLVAFGDGEISLWDSIVFVGIYVVYIFSVFNWRKWFPYKDRGSFNDDDDNDDNSQKRAYYTRLGYIIRPIDFVIGLFFPKKVGQYYIFSMSILIIAALCWALVESAVYIAEDLQIPKIIIALTVLAIGTSVPDLISSVIIAKQGKGGMAISNAFGSNIFDILIGLGLPWMILLVFSERDILVKKEDLVSSIVLLFGSVAIVFLILYIRKWRIRPRTGYILISIYLAYIIWQIALV